MTTRSPSRSRHCVLRLALPVLALVVATQSAGSWAADGRHGGGRGPRAHMMRGGNAFPARAMRPEGDVGRGLRLRDPMQPSMAPFGPPVAPVEQPPMPGRPGRLSPDERRALRQQINDAGRDLYRAPRP
jgi:hypothetical protein